MKNYLSLVKFSHTLFAMPFALIGFTVAFNQKSENLSWKLLVLVIFCMVFARNAAMAFNRYIDRDIDKLNPRTALREIPSGIINEKSALLFVLLNSLRFVFSAFLINSLCFALSPIALIIILGYSLTKRFTFLCHLVLGLGLSLAPIGAYLAVTGEFNYLPLLFSLAVLFWVSGFDIIYALQDQDFDKNNKLNSIPVLLGTKSALGLSSFFHFITFLLLFCAGIFGDFKTWYWSGTIIFTSLLIYQHYIIKPNDLSRINLAFFTTNGIASVVFAVFVILDLFLN